MSMKWPLLLFLFLPGLALGQVQPSFFGNHWLHMTDPPPSPLGAMGKGTQVTWAWIQPNCPSHVLGHDDCSYDWSLLDSYVSYANAHNVDMFFSNDHVPSWTGASGGDYSTAGYTNNACTGMVANLQDWQNFVSQLVARYDGAHGHGRLSIFE